jgi:hypothetical protein
MQKFLKKILSISILLILLHGLINIIFYDLWINKLPNKRASVSIFREDNNNSNKMAIIGCSNLEHNIEFQEVRNKLNKHIDFYLYNGTAPLNYLNYLIENNTLDTTKYETIILYLPYICYDNTTTFQHRWGFYECFASKDYVKHLFEKNKYLFLIESFIFNYYDAINNPDLTSVSSQNCYAITKTNRTKYIDSLITNRSQYFYGTFPFNRDKFINKQKTNSINDYNFNSNVFVFLPPVPNISENQKNPFVNIKKNNVLNDFSESLRDSSLFYDQWYHLNYLGRQKETKLFIERIIKFTSSKSNQIHQGSN